MSLTPGSKLGPYEILALVGAGGMGEVYRALDTKLGRLVAVKLLTDELADAASRRRFQREAKMASSLNHPHILSVYDAGEFDGRQYLVTEYVDGGTLKQWAASGRRASREIVELLTGVADALAVAHDAGILHRDIKPENILVASSGYGKLADFGLAKSGGMVGPEDATRTFTDEVTRAGAIVGTIAYMSPEQASGKLVDARSDIFSFGVVLYELVAGKRPFAGRTQLELLQTIIHGPFPPLPKQVPVGLRSVIEKALEKDPKDRYRSMRDMVTDLRRFLRQGETMPGVITVARKWGWAAGLLGLVIAAGVVVLLFQGRPGGKTRTPQYAQLTKLDAAVNPAISPNGRMLAFVHGPETSVAWMGSATEIYIKTLPDGEPVQLTHDGVLNKFAPRFSPDGDRIAHSTLDAGGWTTWVLPVAGGEPPHKLLVNAAGLTWIPQAGGAHPRLMYSYMTGKGITMAIATATESRAEERTVFQEEGVMDHFSYLSPDGKQILLVEMGFNGFEPCRVAPFDGSSKGRKIGPPLSQCDNAAWSPDGNWMYFSADTGSGFHVWRQRFPQGEPEQVTFGPMEESGVAFPSDGRSFLTSSGTVQTALWIHDNDGDRAVSADAYSFWPRFSTDGNQLYYLVGGGVTSSPRGTLWLLNLVSGQRRHLLPEFQLLQYDISRDGKRIVFVSADEMGSHDLWIAKLDGSEPPRLLRKGQAQQSFFGAAGDVFFSGEEKGGTYVYRIPESGGDPHKVISIPVLYLYGISPDGKWLAVWIVRNELSANTVELYPVEGGTPTVICGRCGYRSSSPQAVGWSADGKQLYLGVLSGQSIFSIPLKGGQVLPTVPAGGIRSMEQAAALPGAISLPKPFSLASPKRSVYVYPKFAAQRNIYRVPVP